MNKQTYFRFEIGQEDRWSEVYGPYEFVQLTYGSLRISPDGEDFAFLSNKDGYWHILTELETYYSDVVIWGE